MFEMKKIWVSLYFTVISCVVLWDLLIGKYILSLDLVAGPLGFFDQASSDLLYPNVKVVGWILRGLSVIFPVHIVEKAWMFLIVFLAGRLFYEFLKRCYPDMKYKIVAGTFYAVNPFIYFRLIAGYKGLLSGYAIAPIGFWMIYKFLKKEVDERWVIWFGVFISVVGIFSMHVFAMMIMMAIIAVFFRWEREGFWEMVKSGMIVVCLNLHWVLDVLRNNGGVLKKFTGLDLYYFSSNPINPLIYNLSLHGFWRGKAYLSIMEIAGEVVLPFVFGFLFFFIVYYAFDMKEREDRYWFLIGVIGFLLATVVYLPYVKGVYEFLYQNVILFRGFREPNKFLFLTTCFYCVFLGKGLDKAYERWKTNKWFLGGLCLCFIFILSMPMMFGFYGQVESTEYPMEWYQAREWVLDHTTREVVVFPWHMYLDIKWIENRDQRVGNPAGVFFEDVIVGDNIEIGNISTHSVSSRSLDIGRFVRGNFSDPERLLRWDIDHVIVLKEADYKRYKNWMDILVYYEKVFENDMILVYRVRGL